MTQQELENCVACPRLVAWRERVSAERRKSFEDWEYWGRPVPDFGDFRATKLIVGLAPAAHGANRTGRMFTGDRSGDWLFRALHKAGVANKAGSIHANDGLALSGILITAVAHCAPPQNRLLPTEIASCGHYLRSLLGSRQWDATLCLGGIAWKETLRHVQGDRKVKFAHGASTRVGNGTLVLACYHPSQQNTFTGRLTEEMLDQVINRFTKESC